MNILQRVLVAVGIIAAVVSIPLSFYFSGAGFVPQTDTFTFVRNVEENQDRGRKLDPSTLAATEGEVVLSEVFSMERMLRYGFNANTGTGGVGLKVTGLIKSGDRVLNTITWSDLPQWETFEEENDNEARNNRVAKAKADFEKNFVAVFAGKLKLDLPFMFVLDTTNGVDDRLTHRVQEIINDANMPKLAQEGHSVTAWFYHLTESSYQAGRQRVHVGEDNLDEARQWFLGSKPEAPASSTIRGIWSIFQEVEKVAVAGQGPRIHVFTDMLENQPGGLSVYSNPGLLDDEKSGWAQLDTVAEIKKLRLHGAEVALHPIVPRDQWHEVMMGKGLRYLASRLSQAGAKTSIEPF